MIAFAITCLLVATVIVALLVATDSLMRGWHSYRALAGELRALRISDQDRVTCGARGKVRPTGFATARHSRRRAYGNRVTVRAAA